MAEIEDTPPATEPLPPTPVTRPLPPEATPATLPDPADLRPAGPARRWTWLIGGITAGAGTAALALSLVANLVTPAPAATQANAATATSTASSTVPATPSSSGPSSGPSSASTSPSAAVYTTLVGGCSLLRSETVDRYAKGTTCTEQKPVSEAVTMADGSWTRTGSGYTNLQVIVMLNPLAESVYQTTLTGDRTMATTAGMKITDDRVVPGLGDKATLLYTVVSGFGHVDLVVLQRNALVTIRYEALTGSGFPPKDVPVATAEAAAIAGARDALGTLTSS
ncbi:hypothetical protein CFP65_0352 [Kitasatospora sp. MMS16-BH015]|uniref:hypothetical protein n=1 Tax=Kitasatospora sp. MMS16-BH015 TaxID=2018025 RepID=UPI000CA0A756|nr:hypothetical protein [Kitasatospora sp. MMS16-BH015]AUG75324.1 hypothetical protein CFP65_0352 [Kitasatospora sp. MMS16-BH015]